MQGVETQTVSQHKRCKRPRSNLFKATACFKPFLSLHTTPFKRIMSQDCFYSFDKQRQARYSLAPPADMVMARSSLARASTLLYSSICNIPHYPGWNTELFETTFYQLSQRTVEIVHQTCCNCKSTGGKRSVRWRIEMGGPSPGHLLLTDATAPPAPAPAPNYNSRLAVLQFFVFLTRVMHTKLLFTQIFHLPLFWTTQNRKIFCPISRSFYFYTIHNLLSPVKIRLLDLRESRGLPNFGQSSF